jgi:hypothetical protein
MRLAAMLALLGVTSIASAGDVADEEHMGKPVWVQVSPRAFCLSLGREHDSLRGVRNDELCRQQLAGDGMKWKIGLMVLLLGLVSYNFLSDAQQNNAKAQEMRTKFNCGTDVLEKVGAMDRKIRVRQEERAQIVNPTVAESMPIVNAMLETIQLVLTSSRQWMEPSGFDKKPLENIAAQSAVHKQESARAVASSVSPSCPQNSTSGELVTAEVQILLEAVPRGKL